MPEDELTNQGILEKLKSVFTVNQDNNNQENEVINPFEVKRPPVSTAQQPQGQEQGQGQGQEQGQPVDPLQQMADSKNFGIEIDNEKLGDAGYVQALMAEVAKKAYAASLGDSYKMMNNLIDKKLGDFSSAVDGRIDHKNMAGKLMEEAKSKLPNLASSDKSPLVADVMSRLLKNGTPPDKVVGLTERYFRQLADSFNDPAKNDPFGGSLHKEGLDQLFPDTVR